MSNPPESPASPETPLTVGQIVDGFVVRSITPLPNLRATAYRLDHVITGAKLLHVHGPDSENLFSITFATPPADDTGLPHILEHAVLGGSTRFPVKEPFFEMVKMSMATFINAMTADAFTVYPVASNVRKDFFNLAEVYCDAVFHPLLTQATFAREGHHLALARNDDPASDLQIKGIVYNEMKGVYSNPESVVWRTSTKQLFPDTPMGLDSGGDPDQIPELTYEDFIQFHKKRYHPSNAMIFIYGDIPTTDHLAFLRDRLGGFIRQDAEAPLPRQTPWTQPRTETRPYSIAPDEPTQAKTYLTLAWALGDATDPADATAWGVLDRLLLGNEARLPLKKALVDSKLGADSFSGGTGDVGHEALFHVGLKGSETARVEPFVELVLHTLDDLADQDFSREQVDAAFQQLAYHHLEIQDASFPCACCGPAIPPGPMAATLWFSCAWISTSRLAAGVTRPTRKCSAR